MATPAQCGPKEDIITMSSTDTALQEWAAAWSAGDADRLAAIFTGE